MLADPLKYSDYKSRCLEFKAIREKNTKSWWHVIHNSIITWQCISDYEVLEKEIIEELKIRTFNILDAWQNYPQYHEIILKLQKVLCEHYWNFNVVFIPEDDFVIISRHLTSDKVFVDTINIERGFGFEKEIDEEVLINNDMLGFVEFIHKHTMNK